MEKTTLDNSRLINLLKQLHGESRKDFWRFSRFGLMIFKDLFTRKNRIFSKDAGVRSKAFKDIYISISEHEGKFLYFIARSIQAKNIVEFGTSFGISMIYLASAIKDIGGGKLITTEIEVDMLFLDGWKQLYLPLVKMLSKHLHTNSIILADDVIRFKKSLIEYNQYIKDPSNGFISTTISIGDGLEYSIKI